MLRWIASLLLLGSLSGCSETVQDIHDTAEAATGLQAVRQSQELKDQIHQISSQHTERLEAVQRK